MTRKQRPILHLYTLHGHLLRHADTVKYLGVHVSRVLHCSAYCIMQSPIFGPFLCGQTARCITMPLGMEVGLSPGPNGRMDYDATWYGSRPRPRPLCIRRVPSYRRKRHSSPRLFGPCLLWPWSPISATAELLLNVVDDVIAVCLES